MEKSTLIQVYKKLSKRDIRKLSKFIRSPYFNEREDVILLFEYLSKILVDAKLPLNRQIIFSKIFPNQDFEVSKLRYTMSYLMNLTKRYFAVEYQNEESINEQLQLCKALNERGYNDIFESEWNALKKMQLEQPYRNIQYHYNNHQLYFEHGEHIIRQSRRKEIYFQEMIDELSIFQMASTLRHSCMLLSLKTMQSQETELVFLAEVLRSVQSGKYATIPAVAIYYHGYQALSNLENEEDFVKLKKLIDGHWRVFSVNEMRDVYSMAINYCIQRLNSGADHFIKEALDLYKSGLDNETFLEDGYLSGFNYKNILRLGIGLGEFDWVELFMEKYKDYLNPKEKENTYLYNLAFFYFRKPDYDRAMGLLQKVEFKDVFNNLDARRMLLRIYYERGEFDALDSLLDSFTTYIHRQKKISYHRTNYLNLIRFIRKMLSVNLNDKQERGKIKTKIEQTDAVAEKEWLLQQLQ